MQALYVDIACTPDKIPTLSVVMKDEPSRSAIRDLFGDHPRAIPPRTEQEWHDLHLLLGSTFSPHQPINERELFVGRVDIITKVIDATFQAGKHVALFGDRGVGKSSLANSMKSTLEALNPHTLCIKRMCTIEHDFGMIWSHVFDDLQIDGKPVPEILGKNPNPYDVFKIIRDIEPDRVAFNQPVIHTVKNVGDLPLRGIVIELK